MSTIKKHPRWESSRKSLFVKTVWVHGQRHVILCDEDPVAEGLRYTARSSRIASSGGKSTGRKVLSPTSQDFHVASVKLLLAEVASFKKESRRLLNRFTPRDIANTLSVQVIPKDRVTYKNIDDDVVLTNEQQWGRVNLLKAFKNVSNSFDTDCRGDNRNDFEYYERNYYIYEENRFNTLSDRVLSWLDLAVENESTGITDKLRADYREVLNQKHDNILKHKYLRNAEALNRSKSCDYQEILAQQWSKRQVHFLKTANVAGFSTMNMNTIDNCQPDENNFLQVTSYRETSPTLTKLPMGKRRTEILRRQLHIFIPNMRKKSDDASSVSSKGSSLLKTSSL